MSDPFFDRPILNSPYEAPGRHWERDADGQPTQRVIDERRKADFITPIPQPRTTDALEVQDDFERDVKFRFDAMVDEAVRRVEAAR